MTNITIEFRGTGGALQHHWFQWECCSVSASDAKLRTLRARYPRYEWRLA